MMRQLLLIALVLCVAACGVKRPLIRPKEIPAFEQSQREKRERIEQEQRELDAIDKAASEPQAVAP